MTDKKLSGQYALVVGGGSGIGLASARLLARDGANVTIAGRTEEKLRQACDALAQEGFIVRYKVCDGAISEQVQATVDAASDEGRLHIAVSCPAAGGYNPVLLYDDEDFRRQIDGNIMPVFLLLKYGGRAMVRAGGGSYVAVSSTSAAFSTRFLSAYGSAKAAVDHLVKVAADELGEANIRVNSVRPGLTQTPAAEHIFELDALTTALVSGQALNRHGQSEDVAEAIRFLAGPEAVHITGQWLAVDGGHTLRAFPDYRPFWPLQDWQQIARDSYKKPV